MRQIGKLQDEMAAKRLVAKMLEREIDVRLEHERESGAETWIIWILSEDDLDRAKETWKTFHESRDELPNSLDGLGSEVSTTAGHANTGHANAGHPNSDANQLQPYENTDPTTDDQTLTATQQTNAGQLSAPSKTVSSDDFHDDPDKSSDEPSNPDVFSDSEETSYPPPVQLGNVAVTFTFIMLSVLISLISHFGAPRGTRDPNLTTLEQRTFQSLSFVDPNLYAKSSDPFASIQQGQIWRLITSSFLHADALHLAFNVVWLFFLGSAIEKIDGRTRLLMLLFVTHIFGAIVQVSLPVDSSLPLSLRGEPFSIGASGAVYGMFGYLWLRPRFCRDYPVFLVLSNIALMLGWLIFCLTPVAGQVANGAQLAGLLSGIALAWMAPKQRSIG